MSRWKTLAAAAVWAALGLTSLAAKAQFTTQAPIGSLRDLSILKPPAGSKVAIVVFEDLGCPHCAAAHPVELATAAKFHVAIERHDTPIPSHIWTYQAALYARYIQTKISPQLAADYRNDIFANQMRISGKDDLLHFTQAWLQHHGKQLPANVDPDGSLAKAIQADIDLARRINVEWTPTIIVVTATKQQVVSGSGARGDQVDQLPQITAAALAQASATSAHPSAPRGGR